MFIYAHLYSFPSIILYVEYINISGPRQRAERARQDMALYKNKPLSMPPPPVTMPPNLKQSYAPDLYIADEYPRQGT